MYENVTSTLKLGSLGEEEKQLGNKIRNDVTR